MRAIGASPARQSTRRRRGDRRAARLVGRDALVLVLALLALCAHSLVTLTHRHPAARGPSVARAADGVSAGHPAIRRDKSSPLPDDCPICRAQAASGSYLFPTTVALLAPAFVAPWRFAPPYRAIAVHGRSHDWRSRAPPAEPHPGS